MTVLESSASTHNYRTVSVNFSLGTDSDTSTHFQQILPSPNRRVKAHLESLLKPQQTTAIQICTWEVAWRNPGQRDKLQWKFSLPDPQQECLLQHKGDFRRDGRASCMSLDWDTIKRLWPKTGLLNSIAIIGKFTHLPSLPPHTWLQMWGPIPRPASLHHLSHSPGPQPPGKPLMISPCTAVRWPASILGHTGKSYTWLGKFRGFNPAKPGVVLKVNQ